MTLLVDTPGVLDMLVRTAAALSSDRTKIIAAIMKGTGGTANPADVERRLDALDRRP